MSYEILAAFKFIGGDDYVRKLDPRTKFIYVAVYTVVLLMFKEPIIQILLLITQLPFVIIGKLTGKVLKSIRNMAFLFFFIILLNTFFSSLILGLEMSLRLINLITAFSIFFQTTDPDAFTLALVKTGISYKWAFTFALAFRFVPTLAKEAEEIAEAQRSRGIVMRKGGIIAQMYNLFPLLIPLITGSIQRAYYVAESLEARGFGLEGIKRTVLYDIGMGLKDIPVIIWVIILLGCSVLIFIGVPLLPACFFYEPPL